MDLRPELHVISLIYEAFDGLAEAQVIHAGEVEWAELRVSRPVATDVA
jgi:hypothetical protein